MRRNIHPKKRQMQHQSDDDDDQLPKESGQPEAAATSPPPPPPPISLSLYFRLAPGSVHPRHLSADVVVDSDGMMIFPMLSLDSRPGAGRGWGGEGEGVGGGCSAPMLVSLIENGDGSAFYDLQTHKSGSLNIIASRTSRDSRRHISGAPPPPPPPPPPPSYHYGGRIASERPAGDPFKSTRHQVAPFPPPNPLPAYHHTAQHMVA